MNLLDDDYIDDDLHKGFSYNTYMIDMVVNSIAGAKYIHCYP